MRRLQAGKPPLLGGLLSLLLAAGAAAASPEPAAEERWYLLELGGRSAGWAVERWWSDGGETVTEAEVSLRLARADSVLEIAMSGRFVETEAGEPVSLRLRRSLGSDPIETTYRFLPDRVEAETLQAGRVREEALPLPAGEWLTPGEARRAVRRHHRAGDAGYRVRTIDPIEGLEPITVTRTRLEEDAPSPAGAGAETAARWREELSSAPGTESIVELDAAGDLIRSTTEILGLEATLRRSDRETALAASGPGPDVLLPTLLRPDRPLPSPRRITRAVYELTLAGGGELPDLPAAGGQRVERRGDRLRVAVETRPRGRRASGGAAAAGRLPPPDQDGAGAFGSYLAASAYLDHDDPEIRRLLAEVLPGARRPADADPFPRGERAGVSPEDRPADEGARPAAELAARLTELVRAHVARKDLDTGFATASEVARERSGDCTEHSVLLAALLRAAGLPSRVVTGLVYLEEFAGAEGVFGYHMWVQAWADGRWLDLDATLPGGFDATHIALATSDLAGPEAGGELDRLLPLVGKLEIRVLEVEP